MIGFGDALEVFWLHVVTGHLFCYVISKIISYSFNPTSITSLRNSPVGVGKCGLKIEHVIALQSRSTSVI
jgi:hypothetical protein